MGNEARKENWKQIVEGPSCLAKECGLCTVGIEQLLKDFEPRRDMPKGIWEDQCDSHLQVDRTGADQEATAVGDLVRSGVLLLLVLGFQSRLIL